MRKAFLKDLCSRTWFLYVAVAVVSLLVVDEGSVRLYRLDRERMPLNYFHALTRGEAPVDEAKLRRYVRYYRTVLEVLPDDDAARGMLGYCYYYLGDKDRAIRHLEMAVSDNKYYFWFDYTLALLYYQKGEYARAAELLQAAIETSHLQAFVYIGRARAFNYRADDGTYRELMGPLIEDPKEYIVPRYHRGKEEALKLLVLILDQLGQDKNLLTAAIQSLQYPIEDQAFFFYYAGKAASAMGAYSRAVPLLTRAIEMNPLRPEPYRMLIQTLKAADPDHDASDLEERASILENKGMGIDFKPEELRPVIF